MKAPWLPTSCLRDLVVTAALTLVGGAGALWLILATRRAGGPGPWGLLAILPSWVTVGWCLRCGVTARRLRSRHREHPEGLCPRCEQPLPTPAPDPVTCTECGLTLSRAEHIRPWTRWTHGFHIGW